MGWTPPTASVCQGCGVEVATKEASVGEVSIIGLDLAKNAFQAHGAASDGTVVFRRKLARSQVLKFFASRPVCHGGHGGSCRRAPLGACDRDLGTSGQANCAGLCEAIREAAEERQRLMPEAIAEAAMRPTMRFVAPKTEAQQAAGMAFRTRDLLVRQRTQAINAPTRSPCRIWPL